MNVRTTLAAATLLALGTVTTASAQIGVGLRGGILIGSETFDNAGDQTLGQIVDEDNKSGYIIGIPVEIAISNVFSIQPELNFQRRESSFTNNFSYQGQNVSQNFERTTNYIEIPLLLKLGYTTESFTAAVVAGPAFGYALTGKQTFSDYRFNGEDLNVVTPGEGKIGDTNFERDRIDWNGMLGLQGGVPVLGGKIILDARYQFSLANLNDNIGGNDLRISDYNTKSRGFSLTLGYMFTLGDY